MFQALRWLVLPMLLLAPMSFGPVSARPIAAAAASLHQAPAIELARSTSKTIRTGPRGGRYYINRNGKKTYCGRKKPRC